MLIRYVLIERHEDKADTYTQLCFICAIAVAHEHITRHDPGNPITILPEVETSVFAQGRCEACGADLKTGEKKKLTDSKSPP